MLQPAFVPVLAVVGIHCIYRVYQFLLKRRERLLRDRVTYMLWTAAQHCH